MTGKVRALLVRAREGAQEALPEALRGQKIDVTQAANCAEAVLTMWSDDPPQLVFTDLQLSDGNWTDILTLAAKTPMAVNVIVVAPFADVRLYVQAIERGAFDFIVPPLSGQELRHVVSIAAENVSRRRHHRLLSLPAMAAATPAGKMERV